VSVGRIVGVVEVASVVVASVVDATTGSGKVFKVEVAVEPVVVLVELLAVESVGAEFNVTVSGVVVVVVGAVLVATVDISTSVEVAVVVVAIIGEKTGVLDAEASAVSVSGVKDGVGSEVVDAEVEVVGSAAGAVAVVVGATAGVVASIDVSAAAVSATGVTTASAATGACTTAGDDTSAAGVAATEPSSSAFETNGVASKRKIPVITTPR
jgi:hypothetical protein